MEEIITIVLIFLALLTIFCLYKMLDKRGLYFSLIIINIITFILTFKISYIFKMNVNIGIIPLISLFSVIYIFIIKYGYKETNNILKITFISNLFVAIIIALMNFFIPAITETISISIQSTFEYNYKILILYPLIVLLSEFTVIKLYKLVSTIQKSIFIGVILTYILTAIIYTILFYIICYINIIDVKFSIFLGVSTYILGLVTTIINTIFINYITNKKVTKWKI